MCHEVWDLVDDRADIDGQRYLDNTNGTTRTCQSNHLYPKPQHSNSSFIVDPLQDLVVVVSSTPRVNVGAYADPEDHYVFRVDFRMLSSQVPHPDSACASLDCKHTFEAAFTCYDVDILKKPAICGDHIIIPYCTSTKHSSESHTFIQVIDWRKGKAKRYPLLGQYGGKLHVVDQRTIVVIGSLKLKDLITLYTLQEPDGSPQRRTMYLPPTYHRYLPTLNVYATPSFHGAAPHHDLIPGYVPSLESQIMVLESSSCILVIDMAIFSQKAIHSGTPVEIPWSDWGPQHTCCFPHHQSHKISVFGSKMAYALPRDHTPEPGESMEKLSIDSDCRFYVHIWDFNKRAIARSKHIHGPDSPDLLIRKPGRLVKSDYDVEIITDHPYTATVCHTSFSARGLHRLFLEQDRLTLIWVRPGAVDIQVISPV
ncbi:hypothetical protein DFH29DRAFT_1080394 [Suillus ampliporus]|nr:hypothetical protein DFH29DRAFT_1080394 [Suillus ampliporus]